MKSTVIAAFLAIHAVMFFPSMEAFAASGEIEALREEINRMKTEYENRIMQMEEKLSEMEAVKKSSITAKSYEKSKKSVSGGRSIFTNDFNPSIGLVIGGRYAAFSSDEEGLSGYPLGHDGERGAEGFSLAELETNFSTSVDDKFYGSSTLAFVEHGGSMEVELEEAYIESLPGLGLPTGSAVKFGRAFWTLGYMNEHHSHTDDFADRPLPYRAFLNKSFNDTGIQLSYVLPTDFYIEAGGGVFRGDDFPFGGAEGSDLNTFSGFVRTGGDIGNSSWRIGGYILDGEAKDRGVGHVDHGDGGHDEHGEHDDDHHELDDHEGESMDELFVEGMFTGDTRLYAADLRYTWAPTGNPGQRELLLQGEYFRRSEKGTYKTPEGEEEKLDGSSHGWYAQSVYRFARQWRVGARYSKLYAPEDLEGGYDPYEFAVMGDWRNSEFSTLRIQYNREKPMDDVTDNRFLIQYVMSIGAHGAHAY